MITTISNEIRIVIGSWGSYNACNSRTLGSKWLDLADYEEWEEIEEELKKQGFQLDGIDEELFIQDIENIPSDAANWDYMSPQRLFEILKEADVLDDVNKYDTLMAFLEVRSFSDFEERVESSGDRWDDYIYIYKGYDWEDYGREIFSTCGYEISESLLDYFDFEAYGESYRYDGNIEEYSDEAVEDTAAEVTELPAEVVLEDNEERTHSRENAT